MKTMTKYQRLFYMSLGGSILLLILSYQLSFKETIKEYREHKSLEIVAANLESLDDQIMRWKSMNLNLENAFGDSNDYENFQENLLNKVGHLCDSLKLVLVDFSEPFSGIEKGYEVETIVLKIQGSFHPLLKLLNRLENNFAGGSLSSVQFKIEKNYKKNKEELYLNLYAQKIKKVENEKD